MSSLSSLINMFIGGGAFLLVLNEVRGLVLAAPVLYSMFKAGGTPAAIWIGVCSLAGIALSVIVPFLAVRWFKKAKFRNRLKSCS